MVAMEIRTERGFPQPRGRSDAWGIFETRNSSQNEHGSLADNSAGDSRNRTVKTADDQRHDNARIGELAMRYGHLSQLASLDCTSSRRSTVMCALLRFSAVTTVYQRDSSSKRPLDRPSSPRFDAETRTRTNCGEEQGGPGLKPCRGHHTNASNFVGNVGMRALGEK